MRYYKNTITQCLKLQLPDAPAPAANLSQRSPQVFLNGEVHDWYRLRFGYNDHTVSHILDELKITPGKRVLDPFCGSGTTLIECMKQDINSVGLDANPSSFFAARVKTNWKLNPDKLCILLEECLLSVEGWERDNSLSKDATHIYLEDTGMIERGWISKRPLKKCIAVKKAIRDLRTSSPYKNFLMLGLMDIVVNGASNVKFGPELYCSKRKKDWPVFKEFRAKIETMISDLEIVIKLNRSRATVWLDDSRSCNSLRGTTKGERFDAVISSPPYPTEHDYTRNSRLELAFLEMVDDRESLRRIKRKMIRSHTKGIYQEDVARKLVERFPQLRELVELIDVEAKEKTHGFARLYSRVLLEYFGGMRQHLRGIKPHLKSGSQLAYVVGDQSSYLGVPIPTADILEKIAHAEGYRRTRVVHWRDRRSTSSGKIIKENMLLFSNC